MPNVTHIRNSIAALAISIFASGCASVAEGVTKAIIGDDGEKADTRACEIVGPSISGIKSLLQEQEAARLKNGAGSSGVTKVLMVHGIGKHLPGYSARLSENLTRALGLTVRSENSKKITIVAGPAAPELQGKNLGSLRVHRFLNKTRTRELLFYELTWSPITEPEKKLLAFDDSGEHAFKRASLNRTIKEFFNSHVPDPMIYLGGSRKSILMSVRQSICWMFNGDWNDIADSEEAVCGTNPSYIAKQITEDGYAFVTHSLGSRIMVDSLQETAEIFGRGFGANFPEVSAALRNKEITVYMLANQLPLLQLGRKRPEVSGQIDKYCRERGSKRSERLFKKFRIVAFSDPNDILSYAIPPEFADKYIDSRICPKVVNISINVANVVDLFGLGEFANPAEAHSGYDNDERVISIIAAGVGRQGATKLVSSRCKWLETVTN